MSAIIVFVIKILLAACVGLAFVYFLPMLIGGLSIYKKEKSKNPSLSVKEFVLNNKKLKKIDGILNRLFGVMIACGIGGAFILLGTLKIFTTGPSEAWNAAFSSQLDQSRRFGFLPHMFMTDEQFETAMAFSDEREYSTPTQVVYSEDGTVVNTSERLPERFTGTDEYGLEFVDGISYYETTYMNSKFYMITIADPKRVSVGLSANYPAAGEFLEDFVKRTGSIGGINAGSFLDYQGGGSGGSPSGITVVDGQIINGEPNGDVAALDADGVLYVGYFNASHMEQFNIQSAVSFGPVLISNYVISGNDVLETGNNPRTAVGQRKDMAIVFLCVDGRQASSDGVTQRNVAEFLSLYDVKEAINMDGGSSTCMYYDGQLRNNPTTAMNGTRYLPTAWLVK